MYTNRAHCRALRLMFALRKEQAYFINLNGICLRLRPKGVQGASGKPPASGMIRQLCRNQFPVGGIDAPTLARVVGLPPRGGSTFFRFERKYQRKPAARRLQRRPTSLCAVGFGLREPNGWMPRIYSGHPIPALRPEQSDHVPWADCPQGLSSSTGCPVSHSSLPVALLASHPPCGSLWAAPKAPLGPRFPSGQFAALTRREKALYCPFLKEGVRNVAHNGVG